MTKKRKGLESADLDWDEQSRTPARSDVSQDKPLTPLLAKPEGIVLNMNADTNTFCLFPPRGNQEIFKNIRF